MTGDHAEIAALLVTLTGSIVFASPEPALDRAQPDELPAVATARKEPSLATPSPTTAPKPGKRRRGRPYDAAPTRDALRAALARCGKRKVPDAAIQGLLAHYGIELFRQLPEDKIADAIKKLNDLPGA